MYLNDCHNKISQTKENHIGLLWRKTKCTVCLTKWEGDSAVSIQLGALTIEKRQVREIVYKLKCLSRRALERQRERASALLFSAVPFSSSLTVERGVSMDQYKVHGEPLVLSHSQEQVLCTAHKQEEETAAVT